MSEGGLAQRSYPFGDVGLGAGVDSNIVLSIDSGLQLGSLDEGHGDLLVESGDSVVENYR